MKNQLLLALALLSLPAWGQKVIVNPDGSHSVRHGSVIVNPDGSHSTIHGSGRGSILVGPNGSHTVLQDSDAVDAIRTRSKEESQRPDSVTATLAAY